MWVSGSSGKLGTEVCRQLREAGHRVLEADLAGDPAVDLLDPEAVAASMIGADAIVHLAAIPSPENIEPAELMRINSLACFNALEQAWLAGVRTAVLASSGSIYGTAWAGEWAQHPITYSAVPVDEDTPLAYVDPYALTKDVTEAAGRMFHRRGMTVTALRFHWIAAPGEVVAAATGRDDADGVNDLWGYVELGDAARACVLSLDPAPQHRGYEALVIAAADTLSPTPTSELLDRFLPRATRRGSFPGTTGLFDCALAERSIGWRPEWDRRTPLVAQEPMTPTNGQEERGSAAG